MEVTIICDNLEVLNNKDKVFLNCSIIKGMKLKCLQCAIGQVMIIPDEEPPKNAS